MTVSDLNSINLYFKSIKNKERLSPEYTALYFNRIQTWKKINILLEEEKRDPTDKEKEILKEGINAKQILSMRNQGLVISLAKRYQHSGKIELADLIQEGNVGLERALNGFDISKEYQFSTYASVWIKQALGRALDKSPVYKIPDDKVATLYRNIKNNDNYKLSNDEKKIHSALSAVSIDAPMVDDNSASFANTIASDLPSVENEYMQQDVERIILEIMDKVLNKKEREIVFLRLNNFADRGKMTGYKEVGKIMHLTPETARNIYEKAIQKIRSRVPSEFNLGHF